MRYTLFLAIFFVVGCQSFNQEKYNAALQVVENGLEEQFTQKKYPQAAILARAVLDAEPDHYRALEIKKVVLREDARLDILFNKATLGSNYTDRIASDGGSSIVWGILLYLPNRVFDVLDLLNVEVGVSAGAGININMTEYGALGAQVSAGEVLIGLDRRHLSTRASIREAIEIFPFELGTMGEVHASTGGARAIAYAKAGIKSPLDDVYQKSRDFWGVGAEVQLAPIALKVGIHPVEIADLLAGFFFIDILRDDLGTSQSIDLRGDLEANMRILMQQTAIRENR